ncbi:dihydrofolate reductase family protein [Microbacterium invictum]|uniref:Dihydrofolate reductase family protein n=1 Tax=Microbacterium invictum TaxID=515415 RepID=A0ABZ0VCZ1_9MICO|nr:dihydrofolate reductase family protein [Microbacterium invictum]WQB71483.1 dihydrofolate reductase family protein [Microbacterium invictum]
MTKLVYYVAISLDGRICAPDGGFEAFPMTGDHLEAIQEDWADTLPSVLYDRSGSTAPRERFATVLMGWNTYAAGLSMTDSPYSHLEQIVFSRSRTAADVGAGVTLTREDPRRVVAALKERGGGDVWLCGGGDLAGQLIADIDRLVLKVNPVVFGDGRPLFAGEYDPTGFVLESSRTFQSGVLITEYARMRPPM